MLIARIRALFEIDIKKIIALSTLRQLGLIVSRIGLGLSNIAFFHLLTHAYFKALLFIAVGSLIHLSSDFQDLRKVHVSYNFSPVRTSYALLSKFRLCGLPFISGFFSKDL